MATFKISLLLLIKSRTFWYTDRLPTSSYTGVIHCLKMCGFYSPLCIYTKLPEGHSDRLMSLQIPLSKGRKATLISVYAPTMTNTDDVKDKFYDELSALSLSPQSQRQTNCESSGIFNARVGADHQTWNGIIGKQGIGKCNSNGLPLLRMCAAHDLTITNTMFRLPNRNKMSWMHPRSKHWHLIDYVLTYKKDRQDVKVTKSVCGAECWTDHRLIVSKLNLEIPPRRRSQGQKTMKRVNVTKLQNDTIAKDFLQWSWRQNAEPEEWPIQCWGAVDSLSRYCAQDCPWTSRAHNP